MKIVVTHKMRKLSFGEKERFLVDTLGIPESELMRIRSIKDIEKRMIKAAKLQWEIFKDIHGDVTAWLSGFPHESKVRIMFGSHFYIREKLGLLPKYSQTYIKFSQEDLRRRIDLPDEITPELAEETGIHIGDGSMSKSGGKYRYSISGDLQEEILYHKIFVSSLIEKLYKIKPRLKITPSKTQCESILDSKAVVQFKHEYLDLPIGEKCKTVSISRRIKESDFSMECLRGVFDTDGHLLADKDGYISLSIFTASEKLLIDIREILTKFGFKFGGHKSSCRTRLHKESTIRFLEEVGLHSIKHMSKFIMWKEFGFSPTFSHSEERLAVIRGDLELEELLKISERRKEAPERGIST